MMKADKKMLRTAAVLVRISLESMLNHTEKQDSSSRIQYAKAVEEDNPLLLKLRQEFPEAKVLLACSEDLTDDGIKELVAICKIGDLIRIIVLVDEGQQQGGYHFSEPIPASIENQKIQFKNIDKEGEIEFIITEEKEGAVGYAIYRMIDGESVDLFGEGMEDCC
ncbi:MAG: Cys-Cys-COOH (seleno)protein SaoC [Johnsonella sp.]|nr:Cys-Cys-COOH (seleno)protein SaoC [Johnsonella sp.]